MPKCFIYSSKYRVQGPCAYLTLGFYFTGAGRPEPLVISVVDFLVALWHFLIPIFDDITDVILLFATFDDRRGLWWACSAAFVLADAERVLLLLVTLLLALCWIPFALLGTVESRGERFKLVLKVLNGWHDLPLEPVYVGNDHRGFAVWGVRGSALRWPILDGFLWAFVGSRSKSSALMLQYARPGPVFLPSRTPPPWLRRGHA